MASKFENIRDTYIYVTLLGNEIVFLGIAVIVFLGPFGVRFDKSTSRGVESGETRGAILQVYDILFVTLAFKG